MKRITKILLILLTGIATAIFFLSLISFEKKDITWGVDFSQMQAENLKLDWKKTYLAILDDLGVKKIKLHTQWDFVEGKQQEFYFKDIDWQIQEAGKRNVNMIYVLGMKTGRWPECHIPTWAEGLSEKDQQQEVLTYIKEVVLRYKGSSAISYWQVENEPLLQFGDCPSWYYQSREFLKKEINLVKSLDPSRQVVVSDSGELSTWIGVSQIGDILGVTIYRKSWVNLSTFGFPSLPGFYGTYPIPPSFYFLKAQLITYFSKKPVISVELQAEPWGPKLIYDLSLEEQEKTMNLNQFNANISYAKKTGFDTFYLWGSEWWYWMKETNNKPEIWNQAKALFKKSTD